jgi:hypothetical protein
VATGGWVGELEEVVRECGLEGLRALRYTGHNDRILSFWLLRKIDPHTMMMDVGAGVSVKIDEELVSKILGVRSSGIRIGSGRPPFRGAVLARVHSVLGMRTAKNNNVPVYKLKKILMEAKREDLTPAEKRKLKAAYTLYAATYFLAPRKATAGVAEEMLAVVDDPDSITDYNMAGYVVDMIRDGATAARSAPSAGLRKIVLSGCHLVVQVKTTFTLPCIRFWHIYECIRLLYPFR